MFDESYDAIIIGAGHAGCEAGLACARIGFRTLVLTMNLESVAFMACNPAIGGTAKGHLVREVDALGGEMGLAADDTFIQIKMLNSSKGPAVQSLRAQMDKRRYHERMKSALENQPRLWLKQGEAVRILKDKGRVCGVEVKTGAKIGCRAVVVATGVYLKSRVIIGETSINSGPVGLFAADSLGNSLLELGFALQRFKTGTPARVDRRSIDFSKMIPQYGDEKIVPFSFMSKDIKREQITCYLTYTNERTHEIIRANLHRAPMYNGLISATGTRYCPSIEDKIVRFATKERHQAFIEPEGLSTNEMYVQGMSTSLPAEVQLQFLRTMPGLENVEIMRPAYAIEYDCIDPTALDVSFAAKHIEGLYFAGQINGSSGYEEAAGQGILAGINAAQYLKGEPPIILKRSDAYIGVLADDLILKGSTEPYRMMTARAEYRLLLRQDNADIRLTEIGRRAGLVTDERYSAFMRRKEAAEAELSRVRQTYVPHDVAAEALAKEGIAAQPRSYTIFELMQRGVGYDALEEFGFAGDADESAREQTWIAVKYEGYLRRQQMEVEKLLKMENTPLPANIDYSTISTLRLEARQKLNKLRPANLGQASRILGISPADISVLAVYLKAHGHTASG